MTEPLRMQDDSIEAMRERNEQSVVWAPGEVPERVGDFLWRAVRDRRFLLDAAPRAATEPRSDLREYLAANLFDGDEHGTLTTSIATFLGEVVDVVNEWLATPTSSPRPTSEETE